MNFKKIMPSKIKLIINYFIYLYILIFEKIKKIKYKKINILSHQKTVDLIKYEKKSLSRLGDGEFKWILGIKQDSFQENNKMLADRLREIILSNQENILIGIPNIFDSLNDKNLNAKIYYKKFLYLYYEKIKKLLDPNKIYVDTLITRPYIDLKDKKGVAKKFNLIKTMWTNKDILIVEGEYTKLGVGNDLFSNSKTIKRIICPSTNAYNKYDVILKNIIKEQSNKLILLALGPTATVLAYDLAVKGYQALDIGHIDIEYEWYLKSSLKKEKVKGKAVNEVGINKINEEEINKEYLDSIIKIIK